MTTIAIKNGVMAYDSLVCSSTDISGSMEKGVKTKRHIAAACGNTDAVVKFLTWVEEGMRKDKQPDIDLSKDDDEFEGIVLFKNGSVAYYTDALLPIYITGIRGCHSIGGGRQAAYGAMLAGKSAVEAIKIAILCDSGTGGKVKSLSFT